MKTTKINLKKKHYNEKKEEENIDGMRVNLPTNEEEIKRMMLKNLATDMRTDTRALYCKIAVTTSLWI